jgi:hypothetical protein
MMLALEKVQEVIEKLIDLLPEDELDDDGLDDEFSE